MRRTIAVLAMVVLAACGRESNESAPDDASDASADASVPTPTPDPPPRNRAPEHAVLEAYGGYWDTWLAANDLPDPDHPGLARYYAGVALDRARDSITTNRTLGHAIRLPAGARYDHDAEVVEVTDHVATVVDCAVDDSQLVVARDGAVLNDSVVTSRARASLERLDDVWKVVDVTVLDRWEGVVPCVV
jgi:hypothetical protein